MEKHDTIKQETELELIVKEAEVDFWEVYHQLPSSTEIEDFMYIQKEFAVL